MSEDTITPDHNDIRYDVTVKYFKEGSVVFYEMVVRDMGLGRQDKLIYRFSEA